MHKNFPLRTVQCKAKLPGGIFRAVALLVMFPLIAFILNGCTVMPNTIRPVGLMASSLTSSMSETHLLRASNGICSEVISLEELSSSEMTLLFNDCALQHLSVLATDAGAATAFLSFVLLLCPDCAPLSAGMSTLSAGVTAMLAHLQYASHECGGQGALLSFSWRKGIRFEPDCSSAGS